MNFFQPGQRGACAPTSTSATTNRKGRLKKVHLKRRHIGPLAAGVLVASMLPAVPASAHGAGGPGPFGRIATVPAYLNSDVADEAAAEIAAVSSDGRTVIYTDSPGERLGFFDITDPSRPTPAGVVGLAGEPT